MSLVFLGIFWAMICLVLRRQLRFSHYFPINMGNPPGDRFSVDWKPHHAFKHRR